MDGSFCGYREAITSMKKMEELIQFLIMEPRKWEKAVFN